MSDEQQLSGPGRYGVDYWQARAEKAEATLDRIAGVLDDLTYDPNAPNLAWALGVKHVVDRVLKEMER